ncbi:MAG: HAMP domain-containing protein [Gammaproteobacteria bacterium]|nr:HAMP domain-containing protein [Gammaproteobacteria bacterium]
MKINTVGWILIVLASTVILSAAIGAYSVSSRIHSVSDAWYQYRNQKSPKRILLAELNKTIGYGGFIHDFKDMVLRNDNLLYKKIYSSFGHAQSVISRYKLAETSDQEIIALNDIEETLGKYLNVAERIFILSEEGKTVKEIDALLRIDDSKAREGLELLDHSAIHSHKQFDTRSALILEIREELGYGGVIHNFKNFIIRGEQEYYQKALSGLAEVTTLLEDYRNNWSKPAEKQSLYTIIGIVRNYRRALVQAIRLIDEGKTPEEIDKIIHVDDQPALLAFMAMEKAYEMQIVRNEEIIENELNEAYFLVKIIPSIIIGITITLLILLSGFLRTQIIRPINQVTRTMKKLSGGNLSFDKNDELLNRGGNEIGQMNQAIDIFRNNAIELARAKELAEWSQEQAEYANKAKSDFLCNMSHELRTPLNAILGFSQLLELEPNINDEQKARIQDIIRAGDYLLVLINDVLDLTKIESGKMDITMAKVNIKDILDDCKTFVPSLSTQYNVDINIESANDFQVIADRTRLKQALLNFISNAAKYNKPGGSVRVACVEKGGWVRIEVTDTGVGLTREQKKRLFTSFERMADNSEEIEGIGIGLVITKRIIELMGGLVGVKSHPGEGSTFWIELDCEKEITN